MDWRVLHHGDPHLGRQLDAELLLDGRLGIAQELVLEVRVLLRPGDQLGLQILVRLPCGLVFGIFLLGDRPTLRGGQAVDGHSQVEVRRVVLEHRDPHLGRQLDAELLLDSRLGVAQEFLLEVRVVPGPRDQSGAQILM
jgi:hypothetical protein